MPISTQMMLYNVFDYFFEFIHLAIIVINLFGWIWSKTRRLNLCFILLTFISWFGLGLYFRIGYCPITDWHWSIKQKIGVSNLPASYIKYLIDAVFGGDIGPILVDYLTFVSFFLALIFSIIVNVKDLRKRRQDKSKDGGM